MDDWKEFDDAKSVKELYTWTVLSFRDENRVPRRNRLRDLLDARKLALS